MDSKYLLLNVSLEFYFAYFGVSNAMNCYLKEEF